MDGVARVGGWVGQSAVGQSVKPPLLLSSPSTHPPTHPTYLHETFHRLLIHIKEAGRSCYVEIRRELLHVADEGGGHADWCALFLWVRRWAGRWVGGWVRR